MISIQFLRRNNKKILAFVTIGAMITFIIPSYTRQDRNRAATNLGTALGGTISQADLPRMTAELQFLQQRNIIAQMLYARLQYAARGQEMQAYSIAMQLAQEFKPIDFLLLLREAEQMNILVAPEEMQDLMKALMPNDAAPSEDVQALELQALADLQTVLTAFDRISGAVRPSQARSLWEIARSHEKVKVQLVDFRALDHFLASEEPTEDQLTEFFKAHVKFTPEASDDGFGYTLPNRVSLQYITISKAKVLLSITADESAVYWLNNKKEFENIPEATTQPTSQPASQPATTRPTTRPWLEGNDVDKEIRGKLADARCAALAHAVLQHLGMAWPAFREAAKADNAEIPVNPPKAEQGYTYNSRGYLEAVVAQVQKSAEGARVDPSGIEVREMTIDGKPNYMSAAEIRQQVDRSAGGLIPPGIGAAMFGRSGMDLAQFVTSYVDKFLDAKAAKQIEAQGVPVVRVLEPIKAGKLGDIVDPQGNVYVCRILAADKSRPARDLAEVRERVLTDWRTAQGLIRARAEAKKFAEEARGTSVGEAAEAGGFGKRCVTTPLFTFREKLKDYSLPDEASDFKFNDAVFGLLDTRLKSGEKHPLEVIDMPKAQRVIVVQLVDASAADPETVDTATNGAQWARLRIDSGRMLPEWFDSEAIEARTHYKPSGLSGSSEE